MRLHSSLLMGLSPRQRTAVLASAGAAVLLAAWAITSVIWPGSAPAGVVLLGVIFGTVTGLLALGLVLIYKTTNIINFAYGAMGGVAGMLAVMLFVEAGLPYFVAMGIGVATGLLVGGLVEWGVIRRFANTSRLILTVATIGLAQLLGGIQLVIPRFFDSAGLIGGFETPITFRLDISPIQLTGDHLLIMIAVPPIILGLAWFLLRTDAGIAVRAAAENADRALLYGIPIRRLSMIVWVIAGGIAGLTFILRAPFAGATSTALGGVASLLLPALAAALVAGMTSLPIAFVAGVGLGIIEQLAFWNTGRASTIDVAFLGVILVALLLQRRKTARAFEGGGTWSMTGIVRQVPRELRNLPEVRYARRAGAAVLVALAVYVPLQMGPGTINLMSVALIWGMVAVSLVILTGWGGNISLGQFAIVGVGAITLGNLIARYEIDFFVMLLAAGVAGGLIALLVGLPALRIQGLFLAGTTLAFAVALDSFFLNPDNFPALVTTSITRPVLWNRFDLQSEWALYYLCLAFLAVTIFVARSVRGTRSGRALISTRDNVRAAGAAAIPTTSARLSGFMLSGVVAGVAGGLYITVLQGAGQGTFAVNMSIEVFSTAVIGGLGSIFGALLGVFSFRLAAQVLSGELRQILPGIGLLVVLMFFPGGLGQLVFNLRDRVLRVLANRRGILVPSLLADKLREEERAEEIDISATTLEEPDDAARTQPIKAGRR